ncbi:hypothetical protein GCM10010413_37500 [Promicromonospora sukumoe]
MSKQLQGKTALVTGSTSNIGAAIAERFAAEGARVVVSGRSKDRGDAVVDRIVRAGGEAVFVAADLDGSKAASEALAREATAALGGRLDVLVNNAGLFPGGPTATITEETVDLVYAVNVKAPFFLVAALAPAMVERGDGAIINMASWGARLGVPGSALYTSSKGAIETLTRSWAAEFGPLRRDRERDLTRRHPRDAAGPRRAWRDADVGHTRRRERAAGGDRRRSGLSRQRRGTLRARIGVRHRRRPLRRRGPRPASHRLNPSPTPEPTAARHPDGRRAAGHGGDLRPG